MSKSKELSEFDRGSIEGCHLCGKSVREIADILQKPKSTVSDVIVKWKRRGSETAEKRTSRPKILGERSRRTVKRVVKQNRSPSWWKFLRSFKVHQELVLAAGLIGLGILWSCSGSQAKHHCTECEASIAMV
ncbi:regulator of chromosome condensation 2 [Trichonephila clavipes]|nr:regulator of chromosome condensation 2 [Trichonephila clavipes]